MQIHNCKQRSAEWYGLRCGRITASNFHCLLGNSWSTHSFLLVKAMERLTMKNVNNTFWSEDIQRGIDLEDSAAAAYELEKGVKTNIIGFVSRDENVGCSPDRFVGSDGMIEIKCPNEDNFWELERTRKIAPAHYTQMQFGMGICERLWCDYVIYQSMERPITIRVYRNDEYIAMIDKRIVEVNTYVDRYVKQLRYTVNKRSLKFRKIGDLTGWKYAENC